MSAYFQEDVSDEYLNTFFERVKLPHYGEIKWARGTGMQAILRGSYNAIEVGFENLPNSRTNGQDNTDSIYVGPWWPTGDFESDFMQFMDLMKWFAVHEIAEWVTVDGEMYLDAHDPRATDVGYFGEELLNAYLQRWNPNQEEAYA